MHLHNWTGPGHGHQLFLEGFTNCFCRSSVFEQSLVLIEDNTGHHSQLGVLCPNTDNKKQELLKELEKKLEQKREDYYRFKRGEKNLSYEELDALLLEIGDTEKDIECLR